jgi:hypothetical protein
VRCTGWCYLATVMIATDPARSRRREGGEPPLIRRSGQSRGAQNNTTERRRFRAHQAYRRHICRGQGPHTPTGSHGGPSNSGPIAIPYDELRRA